MFKRAVTAICVSASVLSATMLMAQESVGPTLLVIPPRYTIVKLAMDVSTIRTAVIVSYQGLENSPSTLHVWNSDPGEWVRVSIDTFRSGGLFRTPPRAVVLVVSEKGVPEDVLAACQALAPVTRVDSLDLATVSNAMSESMEFDRGEWIWLANRYGLTLKDANAERRRYGKYGAPSRGARSEASAEVAVPEKDAVPAQPEETLVPGVAPASAPEQVAPPPAEPASVPVPADTPPENK